MKFSRITNICYIINKNDEVLLQRKARGFGKGKWNGPGGKVDSGETVLESVIREVEEETGLIIKNLKPIGELEFIFHGREEWNNYCHVFACREFTGELEDKGEGELRWFKKEDIPLDNMWEDDRIRLMDALGGKYVKMRFNFNKEGNLLSYKDILHA